MKDYFIVSDVHGFYTPMMKALEEQGFDINNPNHIIIECGDLLDRGQETIKVVDFFYNLLKQNRVILIKGNHEDLFLDMINRGYAVSVDKTNGTLQSYRDLLDDNYFYCGHITNNYSKKWKKLLANMVDYYETPNYVFVHGWIPEGKDWRKSATKYDWDDARWKNGMHEYENGHLDSLGKTIVCGHWHASYGNARKYLNKTEISREDEFSNLDFFKPYNENGIIAIDACTAYTGFVNCLKINENNI